jgi:hypothetical protein
VLIDVANPLDFSQGMPPRLSVCNDDSLGDDDAAKEQVRELLGSFGWQPDDVLDLGDIGAARGTEMYLPLWLRLWGATGTANLNVKVLAAAS